MCVMLASAAVTSGAIEDYPTTYKIEVREDRSAVWIVEHRSRLDTAEEENIFQQYISEFETLRDNYLENFSNEMTSLVQRASVITGRSMQAKNFDVSVSILTTATGKFRVIKYQFEWTNFAKLEGANIIIGDVFEAGLFLYKDDALVVQYPSGYAVESASPSPDETRELQLIWYGQRDFGAGEPRIVLGKPSAVPLVLVAAAAALAIAIGVALWFKKTRKAPPKAEHKISPGKLIPKTDVEKTVDLLNEAGGKMYQSDLVGRTGFSKAKISLLLSSMEKEGTIKRIQTGRKNLIVLKSESSETE
ncbi:MAG TPA: DUF4897 domain-containing protein [Hadesarchaea archaeon]|nr:DUF4897 domain-containing protein [Hadesarchaea archaeon]